MRWLLVLMILAGCADPQPTGGIEGTVWIGPTCPVMQDPPQGECGDKPFAVDLEAKRPGHAAVLFRSGDDGAFRVVLAPGTYSISNPGGQGAPPTCEASGIVVDSAFVDSDIQCDSGIR